MSCPNCDPLVASESMVQNWQRQRASRPRVTSPNDALNYLLPHFVDKDGTVHRRERIVVMALNAPGEVIGCTMLHEGNASKTLVCPKEILTWALRLGDTPCGIVLAHNHPSGDPTPSAEDRALTRKLGHLLKEFGVPLHDHIIVGGQGRWKSFAVLGIMPSWGASTIAFI